MPPRPRKRWPLLQKKRPDPNCSVSSEVSLLSAGTLPAASRVATPLEATAQQEEMALKQINGMGV